MKDEEINCSEKLEKLLTKICKDFKIEDTKGIVKKFLKEYK